MKLANKLRLHIVLLIFGLGGLVWLDEKGVLKGGFIVVAVFLLILTFFGFMFYWYNQKCECGKYIYETACDDWTKHPFSYLLFDGKCCACHQSI